ncbi:unannotated protein [freshwater metagenome]|uniref:Unannotated protein n=1 Tax=freshwater metagenome TaxID=449393 RepID=A0A6J6QWZ6_9ZZZZ
MLGRQAQHLGDPARQCLGVRDRAPAGCGLVPRIGEQRRVLPQRHAVGAPLQGDVPPGQRLTRIPLALAAVYDAAHGVHLAQPVGEGHREGALLGTVGLGAPLRRGRVVEGHEGRLAAHGQAHVAGREPRVDGLAERVDARPLVVGVGLGDAGVLVDAADLVVEGEADLDRLGRALDRRGVARVRGGRERDVALAGEEAAGRVHADPSGAGHEHLGPGVQVGEVGLRSARPVQGGLVGPQLDQVAGHETGGQPVLAQQADQQPGAVAARPDADPQRLVGTLDAGLHPHAVGDVAVDRGVERGQEVDRRHAALRQRRQGVLPRRGGHAVLDGSQVRRQVGRELGVVGEGETLGVLLDEEVEGVDHHQVGHQADGDLELVGLLREDQPRQPVAEGVLLPVEEVVLRRDVERVGLDRGAAVRRRAQPDHVRSHRDAAGEVVGGPVLQGNLDRHGTSLPVVHDERVTPASRHRRSR